MHLAVPLRKTVRPDGSGPGLATVEQDSPEEIYARVFAVLNTRLGHRIDLPEFGSRFQVYRRGGVDLAALERAVALWVPEADVIALRESGRLAAMALEVESLDTVRIVGG